MVLHSMGTAFLPVNNMEISFSWACFNLKGEGGALCYMNLPLRLFQLVFQVLHSY